MAIKNNDGQKCTPKHLAAELIWVGLDDGVDSAIETDTDLTDKERLAIRSQVEKLKARVKKLLRIGVADDVALDDDTVN